MTRPGPYTVVLASVVASVGAELHSVYLGHPAVETRVLHLELGRDGRARIDAAHHAPEELPVTYALERLLLDHAARLRDLVTELGGGTAAVDVGLRGPCHHSPRRPTRKRSTRTPQIGPRLSLEDRMSEPSDLSVRRTPYLRACAPRIDRASSSRAPEMAVVDVRPEPV